MLSKGNYRESFFQAVSNSSWANEGYLVTAEIKEDKNLLSELSRLSASFGIGVILLDSKEINSSAIIFPATPKETVGWETMNKICEENKGFKKFVRDLKVDFGAEEIHHNKYEPILTMEEVEKHIAEKKIAQE